MIIHPTVLKLSKRLWLFAPIPLVVAACAYLLMLSHGVYPGHSAVLTAAAAGLIPQSAVSHPLFALVSRTIASLNIFCLPCQLNLLSALCGTFCAMLIYYLSARMILFCASEDAGGGGQTDYLIDDHTVYGLPPEVKHHNQRVWVIAVAGGLAAATVFIFSTPAWCAATRLDSGLFDLLLVLVACTLFPVGEVRWSTTRLALSVLLFTLGLFESASFLLLLPIYAFFVFCTWFKTCRFVVAACILAALMVAIVFEIFAYAHNIEASFGLFAPLINYAHALPYHHYHELQSFFPRSGWLLVSLQVGIPVLILLFGKQTLFKEKRVSTLMAMSLAALACTPGLLNLPCAPFFLFQPIGHLPVFCSALMAAAFASACAAGMLSILQNDAAATNIEFHSHRGSRVMRTLTRNSMRCLLAVLVVLALVAPWHGFSQVDTRRGMFADEVARMILDLMNGRTWLISNGTLDNHLLVQADQRGQSLKLITLRSRPLTYEVERLDRLIDSSPDFAGLNRLRLKNALSLGTVRFVMEWFVADHDACNRAMVFAAPDIWTSCGYRAVPEGLAFGGIRSEEKTDITIIEELNRTFAERLLPFLIGSDETRDYVAALREMIRMKAGFASNETGVMLEDAGQYEIAYQAYVRASQIDPMNVSAAYNGYALASVQGIHFDAVARHAKRVRHATSGRNLPVQAILQNYGTIRQSGFYQKQSVLWRSRGSGKVATEKIRKALSLKERTAAAALVDNAFFFCQARKFSEAESCYLAALDEDASNLAALANYLLGASLLESGKLREAEDFMRRSIENHPTAAADNDLAENLRLQKRLTEAETFARQALKIEPELLPALDTLACILSDAENYGEAEQVVARAIQAQPNYVPSQLTLLRIKVRQADKEGAWKQRYALKELKITIPEVLQKKIEALK